jgi:hypothetical protein
LSESETEITTPTPPKKFSRDAIRAAFLDNKPKSEPLDIFGVTVYLHEPPFGVMIDAQNADQNNKKQLLALAMTFYVFTAEGEKVFDESDVDAILEMPFGEDMRKLNAAVNKIMGVTPSADDKSEAAS